MEVYADPKMKGLMFHELPGGRYLISLSMPSGELTWVELYSDNKITGRRGNMKQCNNPEESRNIIIQNYQEPPSL
jgi:hypothetical protein